ncbi:unnamed protein product [Schistosoma turkestanicum]|nr:unnamed protein product [Schistosoma turkestanicum]
MSIQQESIKLSEQTSDRLLLPISKDKNNCRRKKLNHNHKLRFRYYSVGLLSSLQLFHEQHTNPNVMHTTTHKPCAIMKQQSKPSNIRRYTINLPEEDKNVLTYQSAVNETVSYMDIGGDNSILNEIEEPLSLDAKSTFHHHHHQSIINSNNHNTNSSNTTNNNIINNQSSYRERGWSLYNLKEQFISFFQPSDNKLALKLFGNKVALACEKRRQREQGKWIIHPCSNFR